MSLLERDEAARELEHRQIVGGDSLPADEQSAKAVVPAICPFDDPAPRPAAHTADQGLFPSPADVRNDPAATNCGFRVSVVVPLVQAQVLGTPRTTRRLQDDSVEHLRHHPLVVDVRSGDDHRQRNAATVREDVTFHAELRAVRRVRPRVAPPFGALAMALSSEAKSHWMPRRLS